MLDYKYEIIEVFPEQNNMMIKFTSEGRDDVITGTPLPTEGMNISEFIAPYAPIGHWLEQDRKKFIPEVGTSGEYIHSVAVAEEEQRLAAMAATQTLPEVELLKEIQELNTKNLVKDVLIEQGLIPPTQ
jgi:hypothetical protein